MSWVHFPLSPQNSTNSLGGGSGCTDWYLTVTTYYDDGTSITYPPKYLYTTCPGSNLYRFDPNGGSGGGGDGNETEDEVVQVDTVRDSLTSPCFAAALNALSLSQVKNYIGDLYNSYF